MTVRVGVIGVGMIGQDHIRRLTRVLSGVDVVAVSDVDPARTRAVAEGLRDARVHPTGEELVADAGVDAVVVCSWGETHEQYVLAAIAAGKPVFCEKPLATTQEACRRILAAETDAGAAARAGRLHAPVRRGLPGAARGRPQRIDRAAAADALHPSQPERARLLPEGVGHHRHRRARDRHGAVDVRRGDRGDHGARAPQEPQRWRAAGPAPAAPGDGQRCARRRRDLGEHPLRLRHPRRGGRRERHCRARARRARSGCGSTGSPRTGYPPTGGSGSSARTTSSCRSGSTRSPGTASSARAAGTATPRRRCRTRRSRRCATGSRMPVSLVERPALYEK